MQEFSSINPQRLFDQAPLPLVVLDEECRLQHFNQQAGCLLDHSQSVIDLRFGDAFGCQHASEAAEGCGTAQECRSCQIRKSVSRAITQEKRLEGRAVLCLTRNGSGRTFQLSFSMTPVSENGNRLVVAGLQDVRTAKLSDKCPVTRWDGSEEFLYGREIEQILEGIPIPASLQAVLTGEGGHPADFRFLKINSALEKLFGLNRDAILGRTVREIFPGLEDAALQPIIRTAESGSREDYSIYLSNLGLDLNIHADKLRENCLLITYQVVSKHQRKEKNQPLNTNRLLHILDSIPADIYVADMDSYQVLFMNKQMKDNFGGDHTGETCWEIFRDYRSPCAHCTNDQLLDEQGNPSGVMEWETYNPVNQTWYLNRDRAIPWDDGRYVRLQIATDITERRLTEEKLRTSEEQFSKAFQGGPVMMAISEMEGGTFLEVNDNFVEATGYSRDELIGRTFVELGLISAQDQDLLKKLLGSKANIEGYELVLTQKNGGKIFCYLYTDLIRVRGENRLLTILENVTQRKRLQGERERTLHELTVINEFILTASRLDDPAKICNLAAHTVHMENPQAIVAVTRYDEQVDGILLQAVKGINSKILEKTIELAGLKGKDALISGEELNNIQQEEGEFESFVSGKLEYISDGIYDLAFKTIPRPICRVIEKLLDVEKVYSAGFSRVDLPRGGIILLLPPGVEVQHPQTIETITSHVSVLLDDIAYRKEILRKRQESETLRKVGMLVTQSVNRRDITCLILEQLEKVLEYDSAAIQLLQDDSIRVEAARGSERSSEFIGVEYSLDEKEIIQSILMEVEAVVVDDVEQVSDWIAFPGDEQARSWLGIPLVVKGKRIGVLTLAHYEVGRYSEYDIDLVTSFANQAAITLENNRLFEEAQRRLERLSSLREIDLTITGSLDIQLTLRVLLDQLVVQLDVDAADIYLLDPLLKSLDFAVSIGFHDQSTMEGLPVEDPLISQVVIENRPIKVSDMDKLSVKHAREGQFRKEGFAAFLAYPLLAKGEVLGILEVFQRKPYHPSKEWLEFLEALAGQAAIAVDRLNMYLELKETNLELVQAYDSTIASLAKALELRDMETEGHSKRVMELTLELAGAVGVDREELLHIRRGALLHDIGKMAIPDHILHKPGELTDEEWEVMKKHPEFAAEMLSSIAYLQQALDIPRYHHERWDGSGYPEGLSGKEIPLSARLFAVVDVWDALRSDRPYRPAWSDEQALDYIVEQSGKQFDPEIVKEFLVLINRC